MATQQQILEHSTQYNQLRWLCLAGDFLAVHLGWIKAKNKALSNQRHVEAVLSRDGGWEEVCATLGSWTKGTVGLDPDQESVLRGRRIAEVAIVARSRSIGGGTITLLES
ncbi:uncharacterized protein RHO25_006069 [Cercospora beticola]|uniref:Uncharacterized protein n=1 Tax=Cercospora beticola TaxID=122368 RepID=A0ABZ0NPI2_CERBT|nr:hypothetical protein RHO25_006069 [Cercospora beticola]